MKNFNCLLMPNEKKDQNLKLTRRLCRYLSSAGAAAYVPEEIFPEMSREPVSLYQPEEHPEIDLIVPLGGDGTIIRAIFRFGELAEVPILGINLGDVGFLAEVEPDQAEKALSMVLEGHYATEERILLEGWTESEDPEPYHFTAMNDVWINRHMMASMIEMGVYINGHLIDTFMGDGMIICTPTGSTAYNLSAGGPIVAPSARNLVITPLCVHSLNVRSIVTSENDVIMICIGEGKNDGQYPSLISIDGKKNLWLKSGDRIVLRRSSRTVSIIKVTEHTFYQTLKKKLF
ncbi:MAG: NAD(+)/NADH kinase [Firmicutes bacterium]|nr:NAD(+)/NADH kinase [Bacillota bacterium]